MAGAAEAPARLETVDSAQSAMVDAQLWAAEMGWCWDPWCSDKAG